MTSYALDEESTWPFVTIPHFEIRGSTANQLSEAVVLVFSPIVPLLARESWEEYATANQGWIQEGLNIHPAWHEYATSKEGWELNKISHPIWRYGPNETSAPDLSAGPYLPVWQVATAPNDPFVVNYNLLSNAVFERVFRGMEETDLPVLSDVTDLTFLYEGSVEHDEHHLHPHSFVLYPIHETFDEVLDNDQENPLVGAATAVLPWDDFFDKLMPEEAIGIIVVVEDTCGDVFSYRVDGANATFLGEGDFHQPQYNYLGESLPLVPFIQHNYSDTHEHCEYFLNIYPSDDLHNQYLTSAPGLYTAVVVMVFVLTTMVFVLYDFFVQQRNSRVVAKAKRSNAIVSALFPKNVRNRIMKEAEDQIEAEIAQAKGKRNRFSAPKAQLKTFLSDGKKEVGAAPNQVTAFAGKPIADLFPSATVMFGDISGKRGKFKLMLTPLCALLSSKRTFSRFPHIQDLRHGPVSENHRKCFNCWKRFTMRLMKSLDEGACKYKMEGKHKTCEA